MILLNEIIPQIQKRKNDLNYQLSEANKRLKTAPPGCLRVARCKRSFQYYYRKEPDDRIGSYLKDRELAARLAQKDYDQKLCAAIRKELHFLEMFLSQYPGAAGAAENVYPSLSVPRQQLITPPLETDEMLVERWKSVVYQGKEFSDKDPAEFITDLGERVRSKSELFIANQLAKEGIPYRYEYPIYLKGLGTVHPDFMILNVRLRKIYLWEHKGMMDNPEYAEDSIRKEYYYNLNGYFQGENLIITSETQSMPLKTKLVRLMIDRYLL